MEITHSYRFVHKKEQEMVALGYGFDGYYNLEFRYQYTEEQQTANRTLAEKLGHGSEWSKHCDNARLIRSEHMKPIMDAIAKELVCYQYDHEEDYKFASPDWDLFFWCDCIHNDFGVIIGDNRDMSYFTLGFNKEHHNQQKQEEVLDRVMDVLERFKEDENLYVTVEHGIILDDKKMREDANAIAPALVGKRCFYTPQSIFGLSQPLEGRVAECNGVYYFMKKRARNRGYLLDAKDIIEIACQLGVKEDAT